MSAKIGHSLNKVFEIAYVEAERANSFIAIEIDTTHGEQLSIDSIESFARFKALADRNNLIQQRVAIYKGLRAIEGTPLEDQILPEHELEEITLSQTVGLARDFAKTLFFPSGEFYTIALFPVDMEAALTRRVDAGLAVRGLLKRPI